uniref:Uncharacterized protein n=1 Tax=Melanopsichium pennsylvanicum 4 TaxID=1398559 RepID=A0A077RD10_9BASI|nr:hypothetical protein BN887_03885 [Melanopsichium pennsylvanicum 4]
MSVINNISAQLAVNLPRFPLDDNTTSLDVTTFVDALALQIYPKGYWQVAWVTSTFNIAIFLSIAIAMRFYRSQKNPVPLWLVKIERRPFRIKHKRKSTPSSSSTARLSKFRRTRDCGEGLDKHNVQREEEQNEVRMRSFITASCVNCHLVLTSAYVIALFLKVGETCLMRDGSANPPLIQPGVLDCIMQVTIFSTAYLASLGYIAILFPNVPPWLWNGSIIVSYVSTLAVGITFYTIVAISASKVTKYRQMIYSELYLIPTLSNTLSDGDGETVSPIVLELAKIAYQEALNQSKWLQYVNGLIALSAILLAASYLSILLSLSGRVIMELVQIRNAPPPFQSEQPAASAKAKSVTKWPSAAVPFSMPSSSTQQDDPVLRNLPTQPNRFNLPLRTIVRTPPLTPAPSGPLPLPPAEAHLPGLRSSITDSGTYFVSGPLEKVHAVIREKASLTSLRGSSAIKPRAETVLRISTSSLRTRSEKRSNGVVAEERNIPFSIEDHNLSPVSRASSRAQSLDIGSRTRLDSQKVSWTFNTLHENLITNEGYVAIYLLASYRAKYPYDAYQASLEVNRLHTVFSCLFTVLYVINSLNLFAPFLLFPASQVKLATMLTSLYSSDPSSNHRLNRITSLRRKRRSQRKKSSSDDSITQTQRLNAGRMRKPSLKAQKSSRHLLENAGKVKIESDRERSSDASFLTTIQVSTCSGRVSQGHPVDAEYPGTLAPPAKVLMSPPRLKWHESVDANVPHRSKEKADTPASGIACGIAALTKLFSNPPAEDIASDGAARRRNALKDLFLPLRDGAGHSAHGPQLPHHQPLSGTSMAESQAGVRYSDEEDGVWASVRKLSPFPSAGMLSKAGENFRSKWRIETLASATNPVSDNASETGSDCEFRGSSEGKLRRRKTHEKQLVLDSLISSHALPIQGFYCGSTANSGLALRLYQSNESVESGIALLPLEEMPRPHQRSSFMKQPRPQTPQQNIEQLHQGYEIEEDLESLWETSGAEDLLQMRELSKRRRQRLRQQFHSQTGQHRWSADPSPRPFAWNLSSQQTRSLNTQSQIPDRSLEQRLSTRLSKSARELHSYVAGLRFGGPEMLTEEKKFCVHESIPKMFGTTVNEDHRFTPLPEERASHSPRLDSEEHETMISIPGWDDGRTLENEEDMGIASNNGGSEHEDEDDDTASIASHTFGDF